MYAVNLADLNELRHHAEHAALLIVLNSLLDLDAEHVVECERRKIVGIGHGVPFICPDEQVEALIALIRQRLKKYQLRIYQRTKQRWVRM